MIEYEIIGEHLLLNHEHSWENRTPLTVFRPQMGDYQEKLYCTECGATRVVECFSYGRNDVSVKSDTITIPEMWNNLEEVKLEI